MNIIGLSFDADGCFYHDKYLLAVILTQVSQLPEREKRELYNKILLEENSDLLLLIKGWLKDYDNAFTYVGSYRQCYGLDCSGAAPRIARTAGDDAGLQEFITRYALPEENKQIMSSSNRAILTTDFFFTSIQTISLELGTQLNMLLMADIFGELDEGVSFSRATMKQHQIDNSDSEGDYEEPHASSEKADYAKISILYTQMHHLACQFPNDDITFMFFDDRLDILASLHLFFNLNPSWIPSNVTLCLRQYNGRLPLGEYPHIQGKGAIDTAYRNTVQLMALITSCFEYKDQRTSSNAGEHITRSKLTMLQLLQSQQPLHTKNNMPMNLVNHHLLRHAIVKENNLEEVKLIIERNFGLLDYIDEQGVTPLHLAAIYNRMAIANYLLDAGSQSLGVRSKNISRNQLGKQHYPPNMTPMDYALLHEHEEMAITLQTKGDTYTLALLEHEPYLVHTMAMSGFFIGIKLLISICPHVVNLTDDFEQTPLLIAASKGHLEIVKLLMTKEPDLNAATQLPPHIEQRDSHNRSILDWALFCGHTAIADLLIQAGATANHSYPSPIQHRIRLGLFNPVKNETDDLLQTRCQNITPFSKGLTNPNYPV